MVFLTKNASKNKIYNWNSFKEAKKKLEGKENPSSKCYHLKKGLKIAFEHEMVLSDCYPDSVPEPKWVTLYNEWIDKKNEYKRRFMTNAECGAEHIRDINAAINLKMNAIKNVGQGVSAFRSVEGVERLTELALAFSGASDEAENLAGDGLNVLTL